MHDNIDAAALVAGLLERKRNMSWLVIGTIGGGMRAREGHAHQKRLKEEEEEDGEPGA